MKVSWRRRLLRGLVCARRGHRLIALRYKPVHPGPFCGRCLYVGGRWVWTGDSLAVTPLPWPFYEPGHSARAFFFQLREAA